MAICPCLQPLSAQELLSQNAAVEALGNWYGEAMGNNSRIFSGSEYAIRYDRNVDHQFLMDGWEEGRILFQGRWYNNLELKFDIVNDQVIFKYFDPSDGRMVMLRPAQERVNEFFITSRHFVRTSPAEAPEISGGFYELIYDGPQKLLLKHSKTEFIDKSRGAPVLGFLYKSKIYMVHEGAYYPIKGKGSLLKVLEDEKKALKAFAREQHMIWKTNPRRSAVLLLQRYTQIKQEGNK